MLDSKPKPTVQAPSSSTLTTEVSQVLGQVDLNQARVLSNPKINGLSYYQTYVSPEQQLSLIQQIDALPWETVRRGGSECRVQRYGALFDFRAGTVSDLEDVRPPPEFLRIFAGTLQNAGYFEISPECFIINEYLPGQQLPPHVDVVEYFGPTVATLSLVSAVEMNFTHVLYPERKGNLILHPGSLLVISDEARYEWKHGIKGRSSDTIDGIKVPRTRRVSVSVRNIRRDCFSPEALSKLDENS